MGLGNVDCDCLFYARVRDKLKPRPPISRGNPPFYATALCIYIGVRFYARVSSFKVLSARQSMKIGRARYEAAAGKAVFYGAIDIELQFDEVE